AHTIPATRHHRAAFAGAHPRSAVHLGCAPCRPHDAEGRRDLQEFVMQVWFGFKQNEEYVHEWTGEVAQEQQEQDVGTASRNRGPQLRMIQNSSPASQYSCKYSLSSRGERPT